jgi:hypothetical protein
MGLDEVGNPKAAAVVSGHQIVEEIEVMNVYQINGLDFLPQGAGQGPRSTPVPGWLNGKKPHRHALPPYRAIGGHGQNPRAILVGGVDAHLVA